MKKIIKFFIYFFFLLNISLAKTKGYYLNLKDVSLKDFVASMSKLLNININIPDKLKGKVTFVSTSPLNKEELFLIFVSILKERGFYLKKLSSKTYLLTSYRYAKIYPKYEILILNFKDKNLANQFFQIARNFISSGESIRITFDTVFLYVENSKKNFFLKLYKKFSNRKNDLENFKLITIKVENINERVLRNFGQKFFKLANSKDFFLGFDKERKLVIIFGPKNYVDKLKDFILKIDSFEKYDKLSNLHLIKLKYLKGKDLEKALKQVFRREKDLHILSIPSENYILLVAPYEKYEKIKNLIEKLDVKKPLVAMETQIVEISLTKSKNFSFQSSFKFNLDKNNDLIFGILFPTSESVINIAPGAGINIGILEINNNLIKALLNAYKSQGLATILSSPNLLTLSGKSAVIEVSRVVPFQTGQKYDSNGNPIITYEYKDVGLKLEITPYVKNKEYILLKIKQNVSDIVGYAASQTLPITAKRRIDTQVLVKNGQTIVIGGIKSRKVLTQENKVPILSDIPIIGNLFRRKIKDYEDTNLLIFITPKILYNDEDARNYTNLKSKNIPLKTIKNYLGEK